MGRCIHCGKAPVRLQIVPDDEDCDHRPEPGE